jgi:hypothetical protein
LSIRLVATSGEYREKEGGCKKVKKSWFGKFELLEQAAGNWIGYPTHMGLPI